MTRRRPEKTGAYKCADKGLFAVGDPDVFHLVSVLKVPATFALGSFEEIDLTAFVGPDLLEIADRKSLGSGARLRVAVAPDGIEVVVLGQNFEEFARAAGDDVDDATREVAGLEHLIEIAGDERVGFGRNGNDGVAGRNQREDEREEAKKRKFGRANDPDGAERFVHGHRNIAERGVVDGTVVFVGPGSVGKQALDAFLNFFGGLFLADRGRKAPGNFFGALRKIFGDVVENLGAIVGRGSAPGLGLAGSFDGVANIFAIAEGRFAEHLALFAANFEAIAGVRTDLLAADVKLHGA